MQTTVFRSKVDLWLLVLLIAAALVSGAATLAVLWAGGGGAVAVVPLVLVGAALPLWLLVSPHYTLSQSELLIRSGPFRWRVSLRDVRSIRPTRNPLSSPALSLDRLRLEYGRGKWIMISPADKEAFVRALEARGINLEHRRA
jgi:fatty acid desaturase